jgi:hypothetical protein
VDVVAELRNAPEIVVATVLAGVDDEGESEDDDRDEHSREQQAAGLPRGDPAAGTGRAGHLLA